MSSEGGDKKPEGRPSNRSGQASRRRRPTAGRSNSSGNSSGGSSSSSSSNSNRRSSGRQDSRRSSTASSSRNRNAPVRENTAPAPRPAPETAAPVATAQAPAPPKPFITDPDTQARTLSAWDLARTRKKQPDTARGQIMTLRTHQKLLASFEDERGIIASDRSYLRVQEGAKGSCLFIHGVSTGPGDLKELAEKLFQSGFNVYVLRLPDYGTPENTISEITWEAALNQARQCFQLLARGGGKVHVVGMGFGATLALHVALLESVSSLVLLAPAIMPRENFLQRMLVRFKLHHLKFVHGWMGWNSDLMEGMDRARGKISKIKVPIYAAQCDDDERACPSSLRFLQRKAQNKASRFKVFPSGGHAILTTHGNEVLNDELIRFCESV